MRPSITELDETRLKAIIKSAQYQKNFTPSERFARAMEHLESLRQLKMKARRIKTETV